MGFSGRAGFGVTGRIDQWNAGSCGLAEVAMAGGGLPFERPAQDLSFRDGLDPDGSEALGDSPNREEQIQARAPE